MGRKVVFILGIVVLLGVVVVNAGCTRAKSAGPVPTTTAIAGPQAVGGTPSPAVPLSDEEAMNAAATALAATQTAEAKGPQITPTPKKPATTVAPTPTKKPATTPATKVAPTPTVAPTGQATPKPTAPPATPQVYVVQPGDNLFRIALRFGTTVEALAAANNIANPALIYSGQKLTIPAGATGQPATGPVIYVVKPGDNLFRIALRYNLLYTAVARANNLSPPYTIYPGQRLVIPLP